MKGDLVRMHDAYGRQNSSYEKTNEYSKDFSLYEYLPFDENARHGWRFRGVEIRLCFEKPAATPSTLMIVPINCNTKSRSGRIVDVGEAFATNDEGLQRDEIEHKDYQFLVFNRI
jgi:hypothetical protein